MAKAKRLPSGNWRVQVFSHIDADGKRRYESFTAPTKQEAEYMASAFQMEKDRLSDSGQWTMSEAIGKYIELKKPTLSPSTLAGYRKIQKYAFQSIMPIQLRKITEDMLADAVAEEMERCPAGKGKPLSPKTVRNEYGLIAAVLARYLPRKSFRIDLPRVKRHIRTLPEPNAVYEAVRGSKIELPCLLAMWLSFSESEIRGLTKSKSIDGDYITIQEVLVYADGKWIRKELAKTDARTRRHKLPAYIKSLIDQVDGDVIVPMLPCNIYRNLQVCLNKAGLPHISFHDLRHINASVMAALNIPTVYCQERGGWGTDSTMKRVYMEVFSQERQQVDAKIDEYFESFVQKKEGQEE